MSARILIPGRKPQTKNYEAAVAAFGAAPIISTTEISIKQFDLLLLPGGGDIHPSFFNQKNTGSQNIDYELDKIQFQLLDLFIKEGKPVLGICKGMQLINIYFGGNILQTMIPDSLAVHSYKETDSYHPVFLNPYTAFPAWLTPSLFSDKQKINSAHHQCIDHLGDGLTILQYAPDFVPEAVAHLRFPILGLQWHPERLPVSGENALHPFLNCLLKAPCSKTPILPK